MNTIILQNRKTAILTAWVFMLMASGLPTIILKEIIGQNVQNEWRILSAGIVMFSGLLLTFVWRPIRALRPFFILFIILNIAEWLIYVKVSNLPIWKNWQSDPSFNVSMLATQFLRMLITLMVIAAMFILKQKPASFFLVKGDTSAAVEPVKWMGVNEGERWNRFGRNLSVMITLGTLTFLIVAGRPSLDIAIRALPFLPAILLAAAMNAFSEEMTYKASFLSVLEDVVGSRQALWLMAAYFGIGHFYGVPYGMIGVLMAGFLGWLLGKSMLETRGLFWAWFIHFWQDVMIFIFLAIGSIAVGGG